MNNFPSGLMSLGSPVGLPLGTGEVFYKVKAKTTSDLYYQRLYKNGIPDERIFTTLSSAYTNMTSNQGDALIVFPGDHVETASLTWAKSNTSIIGAGSLNQRFQPSTLTTGGVRLTCTTAAVDNILNITGDYVTLYGIGTLNNANNAGNVCDIKIAGRNFYAELCSFRGGNGAAQLGAAVSGVPVYVDSSVAGGGNALWLKNCVIGSSGNSDRTKGPGCLYFVGGAAAGFNPVIENCLLSSRISTANANQSCLVLLEGAYSVDRELLFKGCNFYNMVENLASQLDYAIQDECTTTHSITIDQTCTATGIDAWTNAATYLKVSAPAPNLAGGIGVNS